MTYVEVAENLFCGSHPYAWPGYASELSTFDVIVNLSFKRSAVASQDQLVIWSPIRDNSELPPTIPMIADTVRALHGLEYKILVHCDQGLNRAPLICALTTSYTFGGGEGLLRSKIPGCLTNPVFVNYLRAEVKV